MAGAEFPFFVIYEKTNDPEQFNRIMSGDDVLFAFGRTEYADNKGERRCTHICMYFNPRFSEFRPLPRPESKLRG